MHQTETWNGWWWKSRSTTVFPSPAPPRPHESARCVSQRGMTSSFCGRLLPRTRLPPKSQDGSGPVLGRSSLQPFKMKTLRWMPGGAGRGPCCCWTTTRNKTSPVCADLERRGCTPKRKICSMKVLELEAEKGLLAGGENTKYQDDELRKRAIEELTLPEQDKPNITITQTPTAEPEEDREEMAELSAAPTAKRPCQCCCQTYSEILSFLEKRSEAEQRLREEELSLRREELEIQRSKIALERERLAAERKERERRFELESQERQVILDLLKEKVLKG
ncbi:uncharacterized protein LOC115011194 isoform X2 [Cottoperca gobio]|uniref:Uncharacterized protein LOC115011194 isoform X2 n=1 Tax=Cottoperca gobio TaxID=56716 RepID=A0A6J2Q4B9_COTGO|nr:uncharacterized protein LOC115011194 isoform X2 [Cottoperca gobio]